MLREVPLNAQLDALLDLHSTVMGLDYDQHSIAHITCRVYIVEMRAYVWRTCTAQHSTAQHIISHSRFRAKKVTSGLWFE